MAVLKTFDERPAAGLMSFVKKGITLALDFANQGEATLALLSRLDDITQAAGGRIYLAKDARMSRSMFEQTYPHIEAFSRFRDPGMSSALARRLFSP